MDITVFIDFSGEGSALITAWLEVRVLPGPPRILPFGEISRLPAICAEVGRVVYGGLSLQRRRRILPVGFRSLFSAPKIPFPGNGDFGSERRGSNAGLLSRKTKHLVLAGPFIGGFSGLDH